jgi:hypothetical protein
MMVQTRDLPTIPGKAENAIRSNHRDDSTRPRYPLRSPRIRPTWRWTETRRICNRVGRPIPIQPGLGSIWRSRPGSTASTCIPIWGPNRYYRYTVEVSKDGRVWQQVADMSRNTTPATPQGDLHQFPPREARFVRVNMLYHSLNTGVHLVEVKVFSPQQSGSAPGSAGRSTPSSPCSETAGGSVHDRGSRQRPVISVSRLSGSSEPWYRSAAGHRRSMQLQPYVSSRTSSFRSLGCAHAADDAVWQGRQSYHGTLARV